MELRTPALAVALLMLAACTPPASDEPQAAVAAFGQALAAGDREAALALLAPDVLVYEFGGHEASRDAYAAGHLEADMEFLKGATVSVLERREDLHGDLAVVFTRTRTQGTYQDKPVDQLGTETMVLRRRDGAWRITHIHWSSRAAKPKPK